MQYKKMLLAILGLCILTGCGSSTGDAVAEDTSDNVAENIEVHTNNEITSVSYSVGDVVEFGNYEQDDNESNGTEPIEWIVLDTDGSKALLLSKYVLAEDFYDLDSNSQTSWYTSDLFQWLNSNFKNEVFSDEEKGQIVNSEYGDVFLLSFDEAVKYFNMTSVQETHAIQKFEYTCYYSQDALGIPTKTVIENNIDDKEMTQERYDKLVEKGISYDDSVIGEVYIPYWLRTQVEGDYSCANVVDDMGGLADKTISGPMYMMNTRNGVRPAIWIGEEDSKSDALKTDDTEEVADKKLDNSTSGISRFYGYDLPLIFSLDYDYADDDTLVYNIEDKGDYYLVSGSIVCPECVKQDDLNGTFEAGSGRTYTVKGTESYNNDQREKMLLTGADGQEYTIFNIPAFMMDTYTKELYYPISNENNEYFKTIFEKVVLQIDKDTVFYDGNIAGDTFETAVNNGTFENATYSISYDIHFAEDGSIDILTPSDIGSNGVMGWYDSTAVVWREELN